MIKIEDMHSPSVSVETSAPEHLKAIAGLFGLKTAALEKANVLEIGCGEGMNIIPLAVRYSKGSFIGIDTSETKLQKARKTVKDLTLGNVDFIRSSVFDANFDEKKFDYIIVNGLYSWVSPETQKKLLELCEDALTDQGVIYISYNTLPGWNAIKTIREMMIYHGSSFDKIDDQIAEAQKMLSFISKNLSDTTSPYKEALDKEINFLLKPNNAFMLQDFLREYNDPCYFHEFMEKADEHELKYLGDADLPTMFIGNQKEQAASKLADINDIVRQEQYMDFLNNRGVRKSLLVKKGARVERNISHSSVSKAYFLPNYGLENAVSAEDRLTLDTLDLVRPNNSSSEATLSGSLACACYIALLDKAPVPQSLNDIMGTVLKTQPNTKAEEIEAAWNSIVINLISSGVITLTANNGNHISSITNKPEVFKVARHQGKSSDIVTNLRHGTVRLQDDQRLIIQYVTGENTIEKIVGFVKDHVKKNELTIYVDEKALDASVDNYDEQLKSYVLNVLGVLQANALLINGNDDA